MKCLLLLFAFLTCVASAQELDSDSDFAPDGKETLSPADKPDTEPAVVVPETGAKLQVSLSLSDGGVLNGSLRQEDLPVVSDTLGPIRLDLHRVESIAFESAGGSARISFHNGDRLTARIAEDVDNLGVETLLGTLSVPLSSISAFFIAPDVSRGTGHASLLYCCTFDSPTAIEHPAAGPTGRFLGGEFVPGKVGKALKVNINSTAYDVQLPKGLLGSEGTIEFWAKIPGGNARYVDGGDPLFLSLHDERGSITFLQFAANNGFARGGLGGAVRSWPFGTISHYSWSMDYAEVLGGEWSGWHHYAMSWKSDGFGDGSFVKVFVDGRMQPVFGGVDDDKLPARLADFGNHSHQLGSPWHSAHSNENRTSKRSFLMDELKIWKIAKTEFSIPMGPRHEML